MHRFSTDISLQASHKQRKREGGKECRQSYHFLLSFSLTCGKFSGYVKMKITLLWFTVMWQQHRGAEVANNFANFISLGVMGPSIL